MIFCLSQIHTGTVSVLAWLEAHEDCLGVLLSTDVYESGTEPATVYHEHVRADHLYHDQLARTQVVMVWNHRTIIPVRDPLAALISYYHRATLSGAFGTERFRPAEDVVDRWCMLAQAEDLFRGFEHVRYFAWDIFDTEEERNARLWDTAQGLGLEDPRPSRLGLPERNCLGSYPLKQAYRHGDLEAMQQEVRLGFGYLQEREAILRPFLERRGYRDLMWWES